MSCPNLVTEDTERFFGLVEVALDCFFYSRDVQGNFTHINPSISSVLGHSAKEFQLNWQAYLTDNTVNVKNLNRFQSQASRSKSKYTMEFYHKRGHLIWLEILEVPVFNTEGQILSFNGIAWNTTEAKKLEQEIKLREERFHEISECTPVGIFQVDPDDLFIYVNTRWQTITGQSLKDILGYPWWHIVHPEDRDRVFQSWAEAEKKEEELSSECRIIRPDGQLHWVLLRSRFFFYDKGKVTIGTVEDITERKNTEEKVKIYAAELEQSNKDKDHLIKELQSLKTQLEISAKTDPLTGLLNRRGMNEQIEQVKIRYERHKTPFTFIITDIDHFKHINDTFGHDAGDYILREIAKGLKESLRKQDIIARWGGEEFLILLPETDLRGGITLAEKFRSRVEKELFRHKEHDIRMTMSFGLSAYEETGDIDTCIKRADECLYKAKNTGRNKVITDPIG